MKKTTSSFFLVACFVLVSSLQHDMQQPKFLSLFTVMRFPNNQCVGNEGRNGVCYTSKQCKASGGSSSGPCAQGMGVCCVIERSCRNVTSDLVSTFVNTNYPDNDTRSNLCDFRIDVNDQNVCQIRLDFEEFAIAQPRQDDPDAGDPYECLDDTLKITPPPLNGLGFESFCGDMEGQHVYLPLDTHLGPISLTLFVTTAARSSRSSALQPYRWRIRVTQINCRDDPHVAPTGCLQYFTERIGSFFSFNYNGGEGPYPSNLDYAVCIRRLPETCSVTFRADAFSMETALAVERDANGTIAASGSDQCDHPSVSQDYLRITEGRFQLSGSTESKFCGGTLGNENNEIVSTAKGPIVVGFHSDGTARDGTVQPVMERGFHISFEQHSGCSE